MVTRPTTIDPPPAAGSGRFEPRAELALQLRVSLLELIAPDGVCARCRSPFELEELEVDHAEGCTYNKRRLSAWGRAARYWTEYDSGTPLRALCKSCNSSDGQRFRGRRRYA